ncbi:UDP-glucose 6-dehydrogenase [Thermaerobacillus caldiproteolyticus]|uniref:UDP-glucose 6-dehydrogenase n=1 Tax=Thermaerobacillus caldiproteolyticus TaxID=247480 RepID=UPI0018F16109|nr:UDP-glucose 6-dehydrogenase [Anoxybacillus caldiproteolyticus]
MKQSRWSEQCLQHVLQQMPLIQDRRSKEEIYSQVSSARKRERRKVWIISSMASIAAAFLFVIISLSNMPALQPKREHVIKKKNEAIAIIPLRAQDHSQESQAIIQADQRDVVQSRLVTKEELHDQDVVVFGIPDVNGQTVIPVSVFVAKGEQLSQQIENAQSQVMGEEWGLSDNLFDRITISPSHNQKGLWVVRVPKVHSALSGGSASEVMFLSSIEETVRWMGGTSVQFFTENQKGIDLPNTGHVEWLKIPQKKRAYYFYQLDRSHPLFLAPSPKEFSTFQAALEHMKTASDDPFRPSIPKQVNIAMVQPQQGGVVVQFTSDSRLDESPAIQWMLEAILLTAKEFGFQFVTFTGGNVSRIGPYAFDEKIAVPVAPNPMPIK